MVTDIDGKEIRLGMRVMVVRGRLGLLDNSIHTVRLLYVTRFDSFIKVDTNGIINEGFYSSRFKIIGTKKPHIPKWML